jgi:hypothetical protein
MAVLKLDPPPETEDVRELRAWANDMYEQVSFVLQNIGEENFEEDFFDKLSRIGGMNDGV